MNKRFSVHVLSVLLVSAATSLMAEVRTWSLGSGNDPKWSIATNWRDGSGNPGVPQDGDDLVVNASADCTSCVDDLAGLSIGSLTLGGDMAMTVAGTEALTIAGGIATEAPSSGIVLHVLSIPLSLAQAQSWQVRSDAGLAINGSIAGGDEAALTLNGPGTVELCAENTFTGDLNVYSAYAYVKAAKNALGAEGGQARITAENGGKVFFSGNENDRDILFSNVNGGVVPLEFAANTTNVFNGVFAASGGVYGTTFGEGAVVDCRGEFEVPGYFSFTCPYPNDFKQKLIVRRPIRQKGLQLIDTNVGLELHASSNVLNRIALAPAGLDVYADDALTDGSRNLWIYGGAAFVDLHGHSISIGDFDTGGVGGEIFAGAEGPATITFSGSAASCMSTDLTGELTLVKCGTSEFTLGCAVSSTGALIVSNGTFTMTAEAKWSGAKEVRVASDGLLKLASSENFGAHTKFVLPDYAGESGVTPNVYLGSGVLQGFNGTWFGGELQEDGVYGSAASGAENAYDCFDGPGKINSEVYVETTIETWTAGGASAGMSVAQNWKGRVTEPPNLMGGGVKAVFAEAGEEAVVDVAAKLRGLVFELPVGAGAEDVFTLSPAVSVQTLQIGAEGISATANVDRSTRVTLATPAQIYASQSWVLPTATTLDLTGGLEESVPGCAVTKTGAGAVNVLSDVDFSGGFVVQGGDVHVRSASNDMGLVEVRKDQGAVLTLHNASIEGSVAVEGTGNVNSDNKGLILAENTTNRVGGTFLTRSFGTMNFATNAVLIVEGGLNSDSGSSYFQVQTTPNDCDYGVQGRLVLRKTPSGAMDLVPTRITVDFSVASNAFKRLQCATSIFNTFVGWAWYRSDVALEISGGGIVNLHGCDQSVGSLDVSGRYSGTLETGADEPATLFFNQVADTTNSDCIIQGKLSLCKGGDATFAMNRICNSTGDLTVTNGTFAFTAAGSWPNVGTVTVSHAGRVSVAAADTFGARSECAVRLKDDGVLEIADGVIVTCGCLYYGDKAANEVAGTYGATGSGAKHIDDVHFAGKGVLKVRHGGGLVLIVR